MHTIMIIFGIYLLFGAINFFLCKLFRGNVPQNNQEKDKKLTENLVLLSVIGTIVLISYFYKAYKEKK